MNSKNNNKKSEFYEPPARKTTADIISEARLVIKESQIEDLMDSSIKPLQTQRPFTPRDKERLLFGNRLKSNRPPSSFSLKYLQNESDIPNSSIFDNNNLILSPNMLKQNNIIVCNSSNVKKRSNSLTEINDKIFNINIKESLHKVKLPSLDLQRRKTHKNTSLDKLPEENEQNIEQKPLEYRNAFSSPQERTDFTIVNNIFGKSPQYQGQQTLSNCLLLGPQNLDKIFDNKHIIAHSGTLFSKSGFAKTNQIPYKLKVQTSILENSQKNTSSTITDIQQRSIEDVLNDLNSTNINNEIIIDLLDELYDFIYKEKKISSKLKIFILKTLYKYVESSNEILLLSIARVILSLKVVGNNLSGVCKLIFKVAKNDKNDQLFFQKNILELFLDALGRSSPIDDSEACIYGYGTVKFLTMNLKLLEKILSLGILPLMILHMKIINNFKTDKKIHQQTPHVLFQLTSALRNLVSEDNCYDNFLNSGAIEQLCISLDLFTTDTDIVCNISRTLSTISTNDYCCNSIAQYKNLYKTIIDIFEKYPYNEDIIVRLAYTLGNIVAKIDNTRVCFFNQKNSIEILLNLWKVYLDKTLKIYSLKSDNEEISNGQPEDVMIKIIRVIANVVINPDIGQAMNEHYGNQLIDEFIKVLISNPFIKNEELVMSILSTLNNLSYYYTCEEDGSDTVIHINELAIVEGISEYTKSKNRECIIETMRILGNLSRSKITRTFISESEIFLILINLLDKTDLTLLKTTIGVFINLMADNKSRELFKKYQGMEKLIKVLHNYIRNDWLLGMLVCQVIWNYSIETIDLYELITDDELQKLLIILTDSLDEEKLFGITEHNDNPDIYITPDYLIWEEFANVATSLLEKIENFLDTFDHIQIDNEDSSSNNKRKDFNTNLSVSAW